MPGDPRGNVRRIRCPADGLGLGVITSPFPARKTAYLAKCRGARFVRAGDPRLSPRSANVLSTFDVPPEAQLTAKDADLILGYLSGAERLQY